MFFITWVYEFLYPKNKDAETEKEKLTDNLNELFNLYQESYKKKDQSHTKNSQAAGCSSSSGLGKRTYEAFLESVDVVNTSKSDLELYLSEPPERVQAGGSHFDVLQWWRVNEAKYPVLSIIAKDILSIPITTVASEATFSAGSRIVDAKRASMRTDTVEMLLCGSDWLKEYYGIKKGFIEKHCK